MAPGSLAHHPVDYREMARGLFERHLDLTPLRGRHHGVVVCIFHEDDRRPSLSIDLAAGVFHCFACQAGGGALRFAELVGEPRSEHGRPSRSESPLQEARRRVARLNRAWAKRCEKWAPYYAASDRVRRCFNAADAARRLATRLGPDDPRVWPLLDLAATVQREGVQVEAELDAILEDGRIG